MLLFCNYSRIIVIFNNLFVKSYSNIKMNVDYVPAAIYGSISFQLDQLKPVFCVWYFVGLDGIVQLYMFTNFSRFRGMLSSSKVFSRFNVGLIGDVKKNTFHHFNTKLFFVIHFLCFFAF
jgi:hypothetical protein